MSSEEAKLPPWEAERPRQRHGHPLTLRQEHLGPDTPCMSGQQAGLWWKI